MTETLRLYHRAGDVVATMAWNTTRHLEVRVCALRPAYSVDHEMTQR